MPLLSMKPMFRIGPWSTIGVVSTPWRVKRSRSASPAASCGSASEMCERKVAPGSKTAACSVRRTEQGGLRILKEMQAGSVGFAIGSHRAVSPVEFPGGGDEDDRHPQHISVEADRGVEVARHQGHMMNPAPGRCSLRDISGVIGHWHHPFHMSRPRPALSATAIATTPTTRRITAPTVCVTDTGCRISGTWCGPSATSAITE